MMVNAFGKGSGMYLEPGDHLVHIFEVNDNEKTAKPSVDVIFKNEMGQVKDTFWMTDAALFRFANLAIACGFASGPKDERLKTLNSKSLAGREVMVKVVKETSAKDGKDYSVVKGFWKPGSAPMIKQSEAAKDPGRDDEGFNRWDGKSDPFASDAKKEEDPF
jgi:hypothetical protein